MESRRFLSLFWVVAFVFAQSPAAAAPDHFYCERNQIEAAKQVEVALENKKNEKRTAAVIAAGAGCALLSAAVLWSDLGTMTATCLSIAALTYGALTVIETKQITRETYNQYRDPRCKATFSK